MKNLVLALFLLSSCVAFGQVTERTYREDFFTPGGYDFLTTMGVKAGNKVVIRVECEQPVNHNCFLYLPTSNEGPFEMVAHPSDNLQEYVQYPQKWGDLMMGAKYGGIGYWYKITVKNIENH